MEESSILATRLQMDYCPFCGEELGVERVPISRDNRGQVIKTETRMKCEEHGSIIIT